MPISSSEFKESLSLWASGVAIVTYRSKSGSGGLTVSSFSSLSLDPPLVLFCLAKSSSAKPYLEEAQAFGINVLGEEGMDVSNKFASSKNKEEVLGHFEIPGSPSPQLSSSLVFLHCSLYKIFEAGDHWIVVGQVESRVQGKTGNPLLYFDKSYRKISS